MKIIGAIILQPEQRFKSPKKQVLRPTGLSWKSGLWVCPGIEPWFGVSLHN